jgi:hypothetical protein
LNLFLLARTAGLRAASFALSLRIPNAICFPLDSAH